MDGKRLDFRNSWLLWCTHSGSYGRFGIESVCTISTRTTTETYFLLSGVMACNVFAGDRLLKSPPYYYQAAFSVNSYKIFRDYKDHTDNTAGLNTDLFKKVEFHLEYEEASVIASNPGIIKAAASFDRLSARLKVKDGAEVAVELEFPVNHINFDPGSGKFQAETGPVLWTEKNVQAGSASVLSSGLERGYLAFNRLDRFEIITGAQLKPQIRTIETENNIQFLSVTVK